MPPYNAIAESPLTTVDVVRPIAATDGELLMRFTTNGDEIAFAEMVDRHAALVWSVCRQVLRNEADVEDAFQATFLILAQRAKSIRASDSAAGWLYRVAHRTAIALWRRQRGRHEEPLNGHDPASADTDPLEMLDRQHTVTVLVEELRALPERYQSPLVLCYLEGESRSAAAEALDCTTAAIKGRLARGRRMLRGRLARRGVALSVAAAAAATAVSSAEAAVVELSLGSTTAAAATSYVANPSSSATFVSPQVTSLAQQGASTMFYASIAKPVLSVVAVLAIGVATAVAVQEDSPPAATGGADADYLLLEDGSATEASDAPNDAPPVAITPSSSGATTAAATVDPLQPIIDNRHVDAVLNRQQMPLVSTADVMPHATAVFTPNAPLTVQSTTSIEQLQLERKHWELRAEGLEKKALAKLKRYERLKTLEKKTPGSVSVKDLADLEEELADATLLRADAFMAKAKQLELNRRIEQMEMMNAPIAPQLQPDSTWTQPPQPATTPALHAPTLYREAVATSDIVWQPTVDAAQEIAKRKGKLVLIHFWSPVSEPCRQFNVMVAQNYQAINEAIAESYVAVRINVREHPAVVQRFGVDRVPTVVVLDSTGKTFAQFLAQANLNWYVNQLRTLAAQTAGERARSSGLSRVAVPTPVALPPQPQPASYLDPNVAATSDLAPTDPVAEINRLNKELESLRQEVKQLKAAAGADPE